jgi:2-C-methyl-D-erythritol 4-phosphate cytidylyltransferase
MGASIPKQFMGLGGKPILVRTVQKFLSWSAQLKVTLVLPKAHFQTWEEIASSHLSGELLDRVQLCAGGKSRTESVSNGLNNLRSRFENPSKVLVAIHDGVRPFVTSEVIRQAFEDAETYGASVVCVPVKASLRKKTNDNQSMAVDRSPFFEVQTPQTFRLEAIFEAYQNLPEEINFTDDASVYEWKGGKVKITGGSYDNIKITTPEDIFVGEKILDSSSEN